MESEKRNSKQAVTKTWRAQKWLEREKSIKSIWPPCPVFIPNITTRIVSLAHAMEMYI